jgi:hypothetical protein
MNVEQLKLLEDFENDIISLDELDAFFEDKFGIDLFSDVNYLDTEIDVAISKEDENRLDLLLNILWIIRPQRKVVNILNKLLIYPHHKQHQAITKQIQEIADPCSVRYIAQILEQGFEDFEYTCSEDATIAKWFSWALYSIGNEAAIDVMKQHSKSLNTEIAAEMLYRLSKL